MVPLAYALDRSPAALAGAAARGERLVGRGFRPLLSEGLSALAPGEVATATLAGLGGGLIRAILTAAPALTTPGAPGALQRIVAQPNRDAPLLRSWALEAGWTLAEESLVAEGRHLYPTLTFRPRQPQEGAPVWDAADLAFGPILRRRAPPELKLDLQRRTAALQAALRAADAGGPEARAAITAKLTLVTEELGRTGAAPSPG